MFRNFISKLKEVPNKPTNIVDNSPKEYIFEKVECIDDDYTNVLKFIMVGNCRVGKSSIRQMLHDNVYNEEYIPTIGVEFDVCFIKETNSNDIIKVQIWDLSGNSRYLSVIRSYLKECHLIGVVFDLSDRDSFKDIDIWYGLAIKTGKIPILIGNKLDSYTEFEESEINEVCEKYKMSYYPMSAKENIGFDKLLNLIGRSKYTDI